MTDKERFMNANKRYYPETSGQIGKEFAQRMNKIYEWTAPLNLLFVNFIHSLGNKQLQSRQAENFVKKQENDG